MNRLYNLVFKGHNSLSWSIEKTYYVNFGKVIVIVVFIFFALRSYGGCLKAVVASIRC